MPTFPEIKTGVVTQRPFVVMRRFNTTQNNQETGQRYAYAERAAALSAWELNYPALLDHERNILKDFWELVRGCWDEFTFIDPDDASSHTKCRFDQQSFEWTEISKNINSLRLVIVEYS